MVRIAHASTSNTNKAAQVKTANWYGNSWNCVIRPKDKTLANKIAIAAEAGADNDYIYYSQSKRNDLRTHAQLVGMDLSRIAIDSGCDCSSFVQVCCECAGIKLPYSGNCFTTSTMKTVLMNTGLFEILTNSKYLTSDKDLCRGDILLKTGSHVVIALDNGCNTLSRGVDVSKYNQITNYKAMANQFDYGLIRVGYRGSTTGAIVEDNLFKTHISKMTANGMQVGAYFFSQAINEAEAIQEAQWTCEMLKLYNVTLPVFIDSEYANEKHNGRADKLTKTQRTKITIAFCEEIIKHGYVAGVYASDSWFKSMLDFDSVKKYCIWVARYSSNMPTIDEFDMWQYTSSYASDFAVGTLDVSYIYNLPSTTKTAVKQAESQVKTGITVKNVVNVNTTLNIRDFPSTDGNIIGEFHKNDVINIYGYVSDWYSLNPTHTQWVNAGYVNCTIATTTANLNYRTGCSTNDKVLGTFAKGDKVKVLATYDNGWAMCLGDNDKFGFCSMQYLK